MILFLFRNSGNLNTSFLNTKKTLFTGFIPNMTVCCLSMLWQYISKIIFRWYWFSIRLNLMNSMYHWLWNGFYLHLAGIWNLINRFTVRQVKKLSQVYINITFFCNLIFCSYQRFSFTRYHDQMSPMQPDTTGYRRTMADPSVG